MTELYVPSVDEEEQKAIGAELDKVLAENERITSAHKGLMQIVEQRAEAAERENESLRHLIFSSAEPATSALIAKLTEERDMARSVQASMQAKIDTLMLEYCPSEMTRDQRNEWAKHQTPIHDL